MRGQPAGANEKYKMNFKRAVHLNNIVISQYWAGMPNRLLPSAIQHDSYWQTNVRITILFLPGSYALIREGERQVYSVPSLVREG